MLPNLLYGLLLVLPFVYFPGLADPFELPKMAVLIATVVFTISLYKWSIVPGKNHKVNTPIIHKLILFYLLIQVIGSIAGVNVGKSIWGQYYRYQGLATQVAFVGVFYLVSKGKQIGLSTHKLFTMLAFSGTILAGIVIIQAVAFWLLKLPVYTYNGRMTGFLGNPNYAGGFLALTFILTMRSHKQDLMRKTALIILFLAAIVLTQSRAALFAFSFGFVASWFPRAFSITRITLFMIMAITVFVLFPKREVSPFENRPLIWQKGIQAVLLRPVLGYGLENFELALKGTLTNKDHDIDLANIRVDKAHNELIEVAVSSGLIGLTAWIALVIVAAHALWEQRSEEWARTSLLLLVTFLFLAQLNVLNITQYLIFYVVLGLAAKPQEINKTKNK